MRDRSIKCGGRAMGAAPVHSSWCSVTCYSDATDRSSVLQGGSSEHQISVLHANNPSVHLERHFSAGPRQFAAQLDGRGRMVLNLRASASDTQGINHLWQPCVHAQMDLLGEDFSPSPVRQRLN